MKKPIAYIAGKMRGLPEDGRASMFRYASALSDRYRIILPHILDTWLPGPPESAQSHDDVTNYYADRDLPWLERADTVAFCATWKDGSDGSLREYQAAKRLGKKIIFEDAIDEHHNICTGL